MQSCLSVLPINVAKKYLGTQEREDNGLQNAVKIKNIA